MIVNWVTWTSRWYYLSQLILWIWYLIILTCKSWHSCVVINFSVVSGVPYVRHINWIFYGRVFCIDLSMKVVFLTKRISILWKTNFCQLISEKEWCQEKQRLCKDVQIIHDSVMHSKTKRKPIIHDDNLLQIIPFVNGDDILTDLNCISFYSSTPSWQQRCMCSIIMVKIYLDNIQLFWQVSKNMLF